MTTMTASSPALAAAGNAALGVHAGTREYLSFKLGAEEYGIDILKVQEIRGYEPPTRIANAPEFIKGVVNLRGVIVPIVDMRALRPGRGQVRQLHRRHHPEHRRPHHRHGGRLGERCA
jgi:chemotaxis signal transduction protein